MVSNGGTASKSPHQIEIRRILFLLLFAISRLRLSFARVVAHCQDMRHQTKIATVRVSLLLGAVALCGVGCGDRNSDPATEEPPTRTPLRLTLPEMPQLPTGDQANRRKVVALFAETQTPFSRAQVQYLRHLAAESQSLDLEQLDGTSTPETQAGQLAALLGSPPAALIFQPVAPLPPAAISALTRLREADCYVVAVDPTAEQGDWFDAAVSCQPEKIGQAAATVVSNALAKRAADLGESAVTGRVMTLRGSDSDTVGTRIQEGFVAGLASHPGIILVHDAPADWSLTEAKMRFNEALRLQQPIDTVFAHDDLLAQAIHQSATEHGIREALFVVGVNGFAGGEGGIEMIRNQELDATSQRPFLVDVAWRLIQRHLAGEPPPAVQHIFLSPRPIVPTDLDHPETLHPSVDDL